MVLFRRAHLLLALLVAACSSAPQPSFGPTPPPDTDKRVVARNGVVTSANGLASEAGLEMLRAGGNAVDAAVATAFAIGVVEPQMSGLGGGGAALVWMQDEGMPHYLDFYAAQYAPSFRGHTDRERRPGDLRIVGIPGNVAGLLELHERWGTLPLEQVVAPAIRLAEEGFPIGQVLAQMIRNDSAKLSRFPDSWSRYWPNGKPLQPGEVLKNPELGATLRRIVAEGRRGFYEGPVAEQLVATLNAGSHPATLAHLADYRPQWRRPLCTDYRGLTVLSAPPPQTGIQVLHTLELLEPHDLKALGLPTRSPEAFDVLASALRVGMAIRGVNDDPAWSEVPAAGIASEAYARARSEYVGAGKAVPSVPPLDARPFDNAAAPGACGTYEPYGPAPSVRLSGAEFPGREVASTAGSTDEGFAWSEEDLERGETTHISVVDKDGNAVSLTQTNSTTFGVGAWVAGFFLNDSGFLFNDENIETPSRSPWRTRITTISPTIVVDSGRVRLVTGAPGAGRIPTAIIQTMVYTLDYGMDPLEAVRMPRIFPAADRPTVQLEHGFSPEVLGAARAMGYDPVPPAPGYARLYMIARRGDSWIGVADPRHDGEVRGF